MSDQEVTPKAARKEKSKSKQSLKSSKKESHKTIVKSIKSEFQESPSETELPGHIEIDLQLGDKTMELKDTFSAKSITADPLKIVQPTLTPISEARAKEASEVKPKEETPVKLKEVTPVLPKEKTPAQPREITPALPRETPEKEKVVSPRLNVETTGPVSKLMKGQKNESRVSVKSKQTP